MTIEKALIIWMSSAIREPFRAAGCRPFTAGSDARRYLQTGSKGKSLRLFARKFIRPCGTILERGSENRSTSELAAGSGNFKGHPACARAAAHRSAFLWLLQFDTLPIWKSATQQVSKPAPRCFVESDLNRAPSRIRDWTTGLEVVCVGKANVVPVGACALEWRL
jgi:hypothetical protein